MCRRWLKWLAWLPDTALEAVLSYEAGATEKANGGQIGNIDWQECELCSLKCKGKRGLEIHKRKAHAIVARPELSNLVCPYCEKKFSRKDTLLRHVDSRCPLAMAAKAKPVSRRRLRTKTSIQQLMVGSGGAADLSSQR